MALTVRTNGSSGVNLVTASWWNDYYNLLTGAMTDQIVTLQTDLIVQSNLSGSIAAPTLALAAGTTLGIGVYKYLATFVDNNSGETSQGNATTGTITTTTGNQKVSLTVIPTGPTGTVSRKIYRTKVGGSTFFLLTTIADNVTTTFSDSTADASLPATNPPVDPSFGGSIQVKDNTSTTQFQVFSDGKVVGQGNYMPQLASNGGGAAGQRIWVGTTDPGSHAVEGDVWITG